MFCENSPLRNWFSLLIFKALDFRAKFYLNPHLIYWLGGPNSTIFREVPRPFTIFGKHGGWDPKCSPGFQTQFLLVGKGFLRTHNTWDLIPFFPKPEKGLPFPQKPPLIGRDIFLTHFSSEFDSQRNLTFFIPHIFTAKASTQCEIPNFL